MRIQQNNTFLKLLLSRSLSSSNVQSIPVITNTNNSQESKIQQIIAADVKNGNPIPVYKKALLNSQKIAVKDITNGEKSYFDLLSSSFKLSKQISDVVGKK